MISQIVLISIVAVLVAVLAAVLLRLRGSASRSDTLLTELAGVRASSESVDRRFEELRRAFSDGTVVDAVVHVGGRLVPIDSKFPLENFRRARGAVDEAERRRARRDFAGDVRRHVEAIRTKYIRPFDETFDFALMYVPAEA